MNDLQVVTDFDGTLMLEDVGDTIMEALGVFERPETLEASARLLRKEIGSAEWIRAAYPFLRDKREEVNRIVDHARLRPGVKEFLAFCADRSIPVTILSDGMTYYIERIMRKYNIRVERVVSNPIRYLPGGGYALDLQNDNPACGWCGCCKAGVVRELKRHSRSIVYIGDGTSDLYGSGFADWIFARGTLARHLREQGEAYYPFDTFHDVLDTVQAGYDKFVAGTAVRRRSKQNVFCKFDASAQ